MYKTGLRGAGFLSCPLWLISCTALTSVIALPALAQTTAETKVTAEAAPAPPATAAPPAASPGTVARVQGATLDVIVVTAQKRRENIQKVPIAISAFSAQTLAANNVTSLSDLANVTPTLRFSYSGPVGSLYLRGVGSSQSYAGAEAEVQTYIDGVYYASGAAAFTKFNNIQSIEVDKGPQGTLFGRNATGGVIQIFTRDPTSYPTLDASLGYGNYNHKDADLYASNGIAPNLDADIAVHFDDHNGWGKNYYLNTSAFSADSVGVRSKWVYRPSDATRLTFIVDFGDNRSELGEAQVPVEDSWRQSLTSPPVPKLGYYSINQDTNPVGDLENYGASLKLDQRLGNLNFVSITALRDTRTNSIVDADETTAPNARGAQHTAETEFSQEFQLLSPEQGRFRWIVGSYLYYDRASEDPASLSGSLFSGLGVFRIDSYSAMTTRSAALFGQATYNITPTTHLTGGFRYTYDDRRQSAFTNFVTAAGVGPPPPFFGLNINNYPNADFHAPTGKITLSQDITDNILAYIGYNRGFKSGIFNNLDLLSNPGQALQPEYISAYEGGLKTQMLNQRLRANVSIFYYQYSNLQVNEITALSIAVQNAASATVKGIDGDFEYAITKNTHLTTQFSILDAQYDSFPNAPIYTPLPADAINLANMGGYGGLVASAGSAAGKYLPQAPRYSGDVGINQRLYVAGGKLDLNGDVTLQSRFFSTPDNLYSQSGYAKLSASAKWTSGSGKWDVTLWGRNLTDTHTYAALSIGTYGVAAYPDEPLSFGARVGVHF